jgi:hypothetical protein
MLKLLLDEHIAPKIAEQLQIRQSALEVQAVATWEGGLHLGDSDIELLDYAQTLRITLVTYDLRTIAPLLKVWAEQERPHGGVIFVNSHTFRPNDFGGLVTTLERYWIGRRDLDWQNRTAFLTR